jgi:flagellar biosynthesis protein FliQ
MNALDAMELGKAALILVLTVSGPMLIASLIVGVAIGLFQALTQVQEATLTFVPKLMVTGLVMLASMPMIGQALSNFMTLLSARIVSG